jgi:hypothetical protein
LEPLFAAGASSVLTAASTDGGVTADVGTAGFVPGIAAGAPAATSTAAVVASALDHTIPDPAATQNSASATICRAGVRGRAGWTVFRSIILRWALTLWKPAIIPYARGTGSPKSWPWQKSPHRADRPTFAVSSRLRPSSPPCQRAIRPPKSGKGARPSIHNPPPRSRRVSPSEVFPS